MWPVGLIDNIDQLAALDLARAALDGLLDIVLGHVGFFGLDHSQPQSGIGRLVAATLARGDGEFLGDTGKDFAALGVAGGLLVFNGGPF